MVHQVGSGISRSASVQGDFERFFPALILRLSFLVLLLAE